MPQFSHRRTVRLIVEEDMDIDALQIAKSLPDYAENITGIVPQFGGKCFDITLKTAEAAIKLSTEGFDYEHTRKPLRLLGAKSVHVSIFVSVEFPDENLINILEKHGELKTRKLRRLYFQEEGFTHIERGVRVAEFVKIKQDIPKKIVLAGIEVGFKYSGQPATCYRCQSTEHVVKECPKRRHPPIPREKVEHTQGEAPATAEDMDSNTAPSLFTQPSGSLSYADAATYRGAENDPSIVGDWEQAEREEREALDELLASRGRKREPPPASSSDDEQSAPNKLQITGNASPTSAKATPKPDKSAIPTPKKPSTAPGLKRFMSALRTAGEPRSALMRTVPGDMYYRCRGYFLQHAHGDFTAEKAKKHGARNDKETTTWGALHGTIKQDAFAGLLEAFLQIQKKFNIFTSD